jgi:protein phosphatase 1G
MEDAHIHISEVVPDVSVFGVFDGHGGKEVAAFVEKHFIEELLKNKNFKDQKFE